MVWDVSSLTEEECCAHMMNSDVRFEHYVHEGESFLIEKLESETKAGVISVFIALYSGVWNPMHGFYTSASATVSAQDRQLIPDGFMRYKQLSAPNGQQAAHILPGSPMPLWVAEVEFDKEVDKELKGFDKIRNYLMRMVGGNDKGGQPTRIEEAWLFVIRQLEPGEEMLPTQPVVLPQPLPPPIADVAAVPLLTRAQPAYLAIFTRQPVGARPSAAGLAPVRYYPLAQNTVFLPPPDSVACATSPVFTNLPLPRVPVPLIGPLVIPPPPMGATPAISTNLLLQSMFLMNED